MDATIYPAKATPKSQRTRARILDAAMKLFAEVGYHAATNAVIADAAGLTRGAMLYHFATREELVEAALQHEAPFVAFAELEAAARTDAMLRARLAAAQAAFDRAQVGDRFGALAQ